MALNLKSNPVGVDKLIDTWQKLLFNGLTNDRGWANYESYHRAYKDIKDDSINPMAFTIKNDYKPVPMDDRFTVTSFFLVSNISGNENGMETATISVIFQADLKKLYPTAPDTSRFDEELINDIKAVSRILDGRFTIGEIARGIEDVYSGFDTEKIKEGLKDRQPYNVVRFDMDVKYQYSCADEYASGVICNIDVTASTTPPTVEGASDGTATANVTGSINGTLSYLWTTSDGFIPIGEEIKPTATGLKAGTYTVLVTDSLPVTPVCTTSDSVEVVDPPSVNQKIFIDPSNLPSLNSGGATVGDLLFDADDLSLSGNDLESNAPDQPIIGATYFRFTGGENARTASAADLNMDTDSTCSVWFNTTSTSTQGIVGVWEGAGNNLSWVIDVIFGNYAFIVSSSGGNTFVLDSGVTATIGTWFYICVKHDTTLNKIFISATPEGAGSINAFAEQAHSLGIFSGSAPFIYGRNHLHVAEGDGGKLRFYKELRTLSQCEDELFGGHGT